MKKTKTILFSSILFIAFATGCASNKVWYKPETSKAQMQQDLTQVKYDVSNNSAKSYNDNADTGDKVDQVLGALFHHDDKVKQGMESKGYKLVAPSEIPDDAHGYEAK